MRLRLREATRRVPKRSSKLARSRSSRTSRFDSMSFTFQSLLEGLPVEQLRASGKVVIRALCADSRRVVPGSLFFAVKGTRTDGHFYIDEAIRRGAAAIVAERMPAMPPQAPIAIIPEIRPAMAEIARRFHQHPEQSLSLAGITGTNGKTTVAYLTRHFLQSEENCVGMLGTVEYAVGKRTLPAHRTTPEAIELISLLAQMRDFECRQVVMEVSSHAIDQGRVDHLPFEASAFLNLSRDHLDYHPSMEAYFEVKARLFNGGIGQPPGKAIINAGDPWGQKLLPRLADSLSVVRFYNETETQAELPPTRFEERDLLAREVTLDVSGAKFTLLTEGKTFPVTSPLLGHYNVSNLLAALGLARAMGMEIEDCLTGLETFPGVPGRMERIEAGQPFTLLVDYAHTDDALRNAIGMLRPLTKGRLLVLFGCGGNRDRAKRPLMTKAATEMADTAWATSDNPRRESIDTIFDDMRPGVAPGTPVIWIRDRREAIAAILAAAKAEDTVLIAGKGHETYQEFADTVVPFDDRLVAREALALLASSFTNPQNPA